MKKLLTILMVLISFSSFAQFEAGEYINSDTVKIDGVPLLLNTFKQGNLGGASNIFYSTGVSSQPASGSINQVVANNLLDPNRVVKWDGNKFANSNIYQDGSGNVGVGVPIPLSKLSVVGNSAAFDGGSGTDGIVQITTGIGTDTDNKLEIGVVNGDYSWIQAVQAGTRLTNISLNPSGGNLGIGYSTGTEITNNKLAVNGSGYFNGNLIANVLKSRIPTGTPPLVVASTTKVDNLNVSFLEGQNGDYYAKYSDETLGDSVDFNSITYSRKCVIQTQPIHVPNYSGQKNAPFQGYGQLVTFNSIDGLFPFQIACKQINGGLFYRSVDYAPNMYYSFENPWQSIYSSENSNISTVDWNAKQFISHIPTGTPPLVVASTTKVDNLNVSFLEGHPASYFETANVNIQRHITNDADTIIDNEIQDLSRAGNTLSLSGDGTTVDLSDLVNPDLSGYATTTQLADQLSQTITNGVTTKAPSEDAVFDALTGKASVSGTDNYIMKKTGANMLGNSSIIDNGSYVYSNVQLGAPSLFSGTSVYGNGTIELGGGRTGNNHAWIDFTGDSIYTDFGLRIVRGSTGPNTFSRLVHRGKGDFSIIAQDAASVYLSTKNTTAVTIDTLQNAGFGTTTPAARIHSQSTGTQARLGYDENKYTDLSTGSTGNLTIDPTGDTVNVVGAVNSTGGFSTTAKSNLNDVIGDSAVFANMKMTYGAGLNKIIYSDAAGNFVWGNQSSTLLAIAGVTPSTGYLYYNGSTFSYASGGSAQWTADTYGIKYTAGKVGIGIGSNSGNILTVGDGSTNTNIAIRASSLNDRAIYATSTSNNAIVGQGGLDGVFGGGTRYGINGASINGTGVYGTSNNGFGGIFEGLGCKATKYYVSSLNTAPASSTDTGTTGEIRFTADYIYVCVATNTWKRTQISTW